MKEKLKPYLLLTPVLIFILGIFVVGLLMGLLQSLGYFKAVGLEEISLRYYRELLKSPDFLESFKFSLYTSLTSSVISVVLGVLLALSLLRLGGSGLGEKLYRLPIIVPHIVAVLLVQNILTQNGILARILYNLGLIDRWESFPSLLYEKNGIGIIVAYMWKEIPFIAMTSYSILKNINDRLGEVALNLGAKKRQVFFHVTLPLIAPTILSSFIIIFAFSFGAYELPFLLGPTYPKALPVKAYVEYNNPDLKNRPYAMVINMILAGSSFLLVYLYRKSYDLIIKYKG